MEEKQHKKAIWAWTMYDWGNSAFVTTIMAAVSTGLLRIGSRGGAGSQYRNSLLGIYRRDLGFTGRRHQPDPGRGRGFHRSQKTLPGDLHGTGRDSHGFLYFVQTGDWLLASLLFIFGNIGFAGSLVYYDGLLPHVATTG